MDLFGPDHTRQPGCPRRKAQRQAIGPLSGRNGNVEPGNVGPGTAGHDKYPRRGPCRVASKRRQRGRLPAPVCAAQPFNQQVPADAGRKACRSAAIARGGSTWWSSGQKMPAVTDGFQAGFEAPAPRPVEPLRGEPARFCASWRKRSRSTSSHGRARRAGRRRCDSRSLPAVSLELAGRKPGHERAGSPAQAPHAPRRRARARPLRPASRWPRGLRLDRPCQARTSATSRPRRARRQLIDRPTIARRR